MFRAIALLSLLSALSGCAAHDHSGTRHRQAQYGGAGHERAHHLGLRGAERPHAGQWAVAIVGTPVYLAFKTVVCGASLVVAAPTAAAQALSNSPYVMSVDQLGDGLAANCGPPYVLSPS